MIDWPATGTWMQAWAGFAQAGAIVFAAWKAADTFKSWRAQKLEARRIEEAERILTLAYRLKSALSGIRSPLMNGFELQNAEDKLKASNPSFENLPEARRKGYRYAQAYYHRIENHSKDWDDLISVIPVAIALFGQDMESHLDTLWRQQLMIRLSADAYAEDSFQDEAFTREIRGDLCERKEHESDRIGRNVQEVMTFLETRLLPIIRAGESRP